MVGNWEAEINKPSNRSLGKIAEKLGVSIDYLTGVTPNDEGPLDALAKLGRPMLPYGSDKPGWAKPLDEKMRHLPPAQRERIIVP